MSVEEKYKLLKCLKYYDYMTEQEKNIIFAGMIGVFSTIKRVKLRAKCDLVPKLEPRPKMMDTQEQYISAFNVSQNVEDFGEEEGRESKIETEKLNVDDDDDEIGLDFSAMFQGFMNYVKTTIDDTIPVLEQSINNASKVVNQSIDDTFLTSQQVYLQSMANVSYVTEHPLFIGSLPLVSASIGSAVGGMIAGEEGKKAIAQSIGSSLGRVTGEYIASSLKDKKINKSSIKEEDDEDTPRKRSRKN